MFYLFLFALACVLFGFSDTVGTLFKVLCIMGILIFLGYLAFFGLLFAVA